MRFPGMNFKNPGVMALLLLIFYESADCVKLEIPGRSKP